MSINSILLAAAKPAVTSSSWFVKLDNGLDALGAAVSIADTVRGIAVDSNSNSYVIGTSGTTTTTFVFIVKYSPTGTALWKRSLNTDLLADVGNGIAVDGSGNVYVTGQANTTTASYAFVAKYNTDGIIQWQNSIDSLTQLDIGYSVATDSAGNVYVTGQGSGTTAANAFVFIAKYNTLGVSQWQYQIDTSGVSDIGYGIAVDGSGNIYITGQANTGIASNAFVAKYNNDGVIQWQRTLDTTVVAPAANVSDIGYAIAVDSSGNVYVTGQANTTTTSSAFVVKYDTSGAIQWKKSIDTASVLDYGTGIAVDSSGGVYVTVLSNNTGTSSMYIIVKFNSSDGTVVWKNTLNSPTYDLSYCIAVDNAGSFFVAGGHNTTNGSYVLVMRLPADGSKTSATAYSLASVSYTYASVGALVSPLVTDATLTDAVGTLLPSILNKFHWIARFDSATTVADISYGVDVDTAGNVYIVGQANSTTAAYIFVAKYNSGGVNQWVRSLNSPGSVLDTGRGIAVDTDGNVYITGQANATTSTASYVFVVKYNTDGIKQWDRSIDSPTAYGDIGYSIAVDSTDGVYVCGSAQSSGTTAVYAFIVKYKKDGTYVWQRKLDCSGTADFAYGIASDSSGNVYVVGSTNATLGANIFLVKYNTDGIIQWNKLWTTLLLGDYGYGVKADASGNIYITGLAGGDSGVTTSDVITMKFNADGSVAWQRRYEIGASIPSSGNSIAIDGSGNVYVTGQANTSTASYATVLKYNSAGDIQWQRKFDSTASVSDIGYGIAVDGSGNIYITGQANTTTASYAFVAKVLASGDYAYNTSLLTYSSIAFTDSAGTLETIDPTIYWYLTLDTSSVSDVVGKMTIDSSNNIYITGQANATTASYTFVVKFDSTGSMIWRRKFDNPLLSDIGTGIAVDSSSNVYVSGYSMVGTTNVIFVVKCNSDGLIQWKKKLDVSGATYGGVHFDPTYPTSIAVSPTTGQVIVTGNNSGNYAILTCFSNAGAVQSSRYWYAVYYSPVLNTFPVRITASAFDSSGAFYLTGSYNTTSLSAANILLMKGSLTTTTIDYVAINMISGGSKGFGYDIKLDSSKNIYITGCNRTDAFQKSTTIKLTNTSTTTVGTVSWAVEYLSTNPSTGIAVAPDGSAVYTINNDHQITKLDSTGAGVWNTKIGAPSITTGSCSIELDSTKNNLYTTTSFSNAAYLFKLPVNGFTNSIGSLAYYNGTATTTAVSTNLFLIPSSGVNANGWNGIRSSAFDNMNYVSNFTALGEDVAAITISDKSNMSVIDTAGTLLAGTNVVTTLVDSDPTTPTNLLILSTTQFGLVSAASSIPESDVGPTFTSTLLSI